MSTTTYTINGDQTIIQQKLNESQLNTNGTGYTYDDDIMKMLLNNTTGATGEDFYIDTNDTSTGIEKFNPSADFYNILNAWNELDLLATKFIALYEKYNANGDLASATGILDADVIKQRLKDYVVMYSHD